MVKGTHIRRNLPVACLALAVVTLATGSAAEADRSGPLAEVEVTEGAIVFRPTCEFERLVLKISGPDSRFSRSFKDRPIVKLAELGGEGPPHGTFRYELERVPKVEPRVRERLAQARASGDDKMVAELRKRGLLPSGPFVQSGTFTLLEGKFVDWEREEEESVRPAGTEGDLQIEGDLEVKGAKRFRLLDPANGGREILFAALEGPEVGTYYRGSARLVDGSAVVELPETFGRATEEDGLTVQLTPIGGWARLWVAELSNRRLVVRDAGGGDAVRFDFLVQGVRRGYAEAEIERVVDRDGSQP